MAARLPRTRQELLSTPGIGERKADTYGAQFLREIAAFVEETGATPVALEAPARRTRGSLNLTARTSLELFNRGEDIESIARIRGFARTTIEGHLLEAMEAGQAIDINRLLEPGRRKAIEKVMGEVGPDYLGPIMERLGDGYTYGELRFVRAAYRANQ
jgi:ATP-dependent DNA helicase RecQ